MRVDPVAAQENLSSPLYPFSLAALSSTAANRTFLLHHPNEEVQGPHSVSGLRIGHQYVNADAVQSLFAKGGVLKREEDLAVIYAGMEPARLKEMSWHTVIGVPLFNEVNWYSHPSFSSSPERRHEVDTQILHYYQSYTTSVHPPVDSLQPQP